MLMKFFFFNDTATTEIYTLSLHDALPILLYKSGTVAVPENAADCLTTLPALDATRRAWLTTALRRTQPEHPWLRDLCRDRKSTRLNSSHANISYAVFCLKKKTKLDHLPPI